MENKVINISDYFETKEDEDFELDLKSYEDIDDYLSGTDSYQEKLKFLKNEREKLTKLSKYITESEERFKSTTGYLEDMEKSLIDLKKDFKKEIILSVAAGLGSAVLTYDFIKIAFTSNPVILLNLLLSIITIYMLGVFAYKLHCAIEDKNEIKELSQRIEEYKRILK